MIEKESDNKGIFVLQLFDTASELEEMERWLQSNPVSLSYSTSISFLSLYNRFSSLLQQYVLSLAFLTD